MSGDSFRLYGTELREPEARVLTAGDLSVTLQDGNLRTLRFKGHEVLRAVAFLVRDKDWGTCNASITGLSVRSEDYGFTISYVARFTAPSGANLDCEVSILGTPDGLNFSADCVSDAAFETARAGFAVLHPIVGVAGEAVTVEHTDGTIEQARWPDRIDPWQPFKEIAAITHRVADGIEATTRFEGDVFEMEDQRNWTDGSYKTYVRPLALPWPYMLERDKAFSQRISVTIKADENAAPTQGTGEAISIRILPTSLKLPDIGVGLRPECVEQDRRAIETLIATAAKHLIANFDPLAGHGVEVLKGYAAIAEESGVKVTLELAVPCVRPLREEFSGIAALVRQSGLTLDTLFVSPAIDRQSTPPGSVWLACPPLEDVYAAARGAFPGIRLGGGMLSYFTELNRKRVPADDIDYVSHCTNPIVHAADDLSVMQTFEALRYVVASTRAIYGDKPYRIGPSTIAMRQNPYGSATKDNPSLARVPMANTDPRHNGQFSAAWTLAYAATVASAGLEVLTLSTLTGPFGLIAGKGEPVQEGELRPLAQVISRLGALSGEDYHAVETSRPDAVIGLATHGRLLLANITPQIRRVALPIKAREITSLSIEQRKIPATDILELGAYECAEAVFDPA
ncbi:MAG: hypothetical protein JWL86_4119 [Rhizobium sp.]|nr:hypothetical protein [Rhizobium sp.]